MVSPSLLQHQQRGHFCWWQSGLSLTLTQPLLSSGPLSLSLSFPLFLSLLSDGETGLVHLSQEAPSVSGECVFALIEPTGASDSAWICVWSSTACVCSSALLPKQSHALTQAISVLPVTPRGRGNTWEMLPHTLLRWYYASHTFKARQGGIARNTPRWLIWSFNSSCDSMSQTNRTTIERSSWPWPRRLTHHQSPRRCVLKTQSGPDTERKPSWIAAGGNRKAERSLSPRWSRVWEQEVSKHPLTNKSRTHLGFESKIRAKRRRLGESRGKWSESHRERKKC